MEAEKDIQRLKINWVFIVFAYTMNSINYFCVMPINHQYIINPTLEALNVTNEVNTIIMIITSFINSYLTIGSH